MNEIVRFWYVKEYYIGLQFKDGEEKVLNLRPYIGEGFTRELLRPEKFMQAYIDDGGGLAWPNGYDFCPNLLKALKSE